MTLLKTPSKAPTETRRFDAVQPGEELPALAVPITVALIAGGAIATRDYFPGHHDLEAARALGSPHIFMNILTTNGLVQRFVENWTGPGAQLCDLKIKLGAPNYPGDTMTFSGAVSDLRAEDRSVQVALKGKNAMGNHVSGTVRVRLP
jgi:acyl dehydratase